MRNPDLIITGVSGWLGKRLLRLLIEKQGTGLVPLDQKFIPLIFIFAEQIIKIIGPGLSDEIHIIAVEQLKIMSPITIIAGLIGLGFGSLNSRNQFLIRSISPLISSVTLILFIGIYWMQNGYIIPSYEVSLRGGLLLASATLLGAASQWILQIPYLIKYIYQYPLLFQDQPEVFQFL